MQKYTFWGIWQKNDVEKFENLQSSSESPRISTLQPFKFFLMCSYF